MMGVKGIGVDGSCTITAALTLSKVPVLAGILQYQVKTSESAGLASLGLMAKEIESPSPITGVRLACLALLAAMKEVGARLAKCPALAPMAALIESVTLEETPKVVVSASTSESTPLSTSQKKTI